MGKTISVASFSPLPAPIFPSLQFQFDIKVSCYEIYNEKIYDLLRPNIPGERAPALRVREHASTGPYVENLTVRDVMSQEDVKVYIDIANKNRATAATAMNDRSSRSHAVFQIILHQTKASACQFFLLDIIVPLAGR